VISLDWPVRESQFEYSIEGTILLFMHLHNLFLRIASHLVVFLTYFLADFDGI